MATRHTPERIIRKSRETERLAGEGATTEEAAKQVEVSEKSAQSPPTIPAYEGQCGRSAAGQQAMSIP